MADDRVTATVRHEGTILGVNNRMLDALKGAGLLEAAGSDPDIARLPMYRVRPGRGWAEVDAAVAAVKVAIGD